MGNILKAMWLTLRKVFRDTHTQADNETYAWEKVAGSGSLAVYLYANWYHLKDDSIFDPVQFATGLCAIITCVCVGVAVKSATKADQVPR
jgi:hypothetical protein